MILRAVLVCTPNPTREADSMRKLTFAMNVSLDGYIAAPGDDLGWSVPSDELFQRWSDRVGATGLALYGRKLWETMSSHWPTADQQPGATLAAAAMRAGLIDEYAIVTHPVLVGGGTPFFTALDNWVNLNLVETRTFPDGVLLTRYETRRSIPDLGQPRAHNADADEPPAAPRAPIGGTAPPTGPPPRPPGRPPTKAF